MFHFADPEDAGLGVITLTPGLTRSSQLVMCRGLPLRTRKTTTESVRMPWVGVWFQLLSTRPASTSLVDVRLERQVHLVGVQSTDDGA